MAQFSIKADAVRSAADTEERLRRELDNIQQSIRSVSGSLSIKTSAAFGIKRRLNSLAGSVGNHQSSMGAMKNALERLAELYGNTERSICGQAKDGMKSMRLPVGTTGSSLLFGVWESLKNVIGAVGAAVGGIFSPVTTIWGKITGVVKDFLDRIGKGDVTDQQPKPDWGETVQPGLPTIGGVIGGAAAGGVIAGGTTADGTTMGGTPADRAPSYNLPEYAKAFSDPYGKNGNYVNWRSGGCGSVAYRNSGGNLSCTYYTLRRLKERGLGYPCTGGPGNGKDWYKNFDKSCGMPHYEGSNALTDLTNNLTLPQANIVVSFNSLKHAYGHVLLIDEIYRDKNGAVMIKYSDMYRPKKIYDLKDNNPTLEQTFDEFMSAYKRDGYTVNGAAVIGAEHK